MKGYDLSCVEGVDEMIAGLDARIDACRRDGPRNDAKAYALVRDHIIDWRDCLTGDARDGDWGDDPGVGVIDLDRYVADMFDPGGDDEEGGAK
jgi:hypothetical protein